MDNKGLVIKSTGSWYTVLDGNLTIPCRIKGKFRLKDTKTTNPVTVGDKVGYEVQEDGNGIIISIDNRKNYIIRKATQFHKESHLLAANIDLALLMVSLRDPVTRHEFIDRFLVTAEAYQIPCIILINKIDLLSEKADEELDEFIRTYTLAGYKCYPLSVEKKINTDAILAQLQGKTNLLAGNSGVGKTSLINLYSPGLQLKTSEISGSHKAGKHTTTFSELFMLNNNTHIIDSPGIKGFGLIDMEKSEIGLYFPEIFRISKKCRFYNCSHVHEPGCAVVDAVANNQIGRSRYKSYLSIFTEEHSKHR